MTPPHRSGARRALDRLRRKATDDDRLPVGPIAMDPDEALAPDSDRARSTSGVRWEASKRPRGAKRRWHAAAWASGAMMFGVDASSAMELIGSENVGHDAVVETWEQRTARARRGPNTVQVTKQEPAEQGPIPLARVGDVDLVIPDGTPIVVGFHEAGGPSPKPMEPRTNLDLDLHDHSHVEPTDDAESVEHLAMVMPSRGRGYHPASAVDVALEPDAPVTSPVSGEVIAVSQYTLYGDTLDWVVQIIPDQDRGKLVEVFHVVDPTIKPGERVEAGETQIAERTRQLPFTSQIDPFAAQVDGAAAPHVHIEVQDL